MLSATSFSYLWLRKQGHELTKRIKIDLFFRNSIQYFLGVLSTFGFFKVHLSQEVGIKMRDLVSVSKCKRSVYVDLTNNRNNFFLITIYHLLYNILPECVWNILVGLFLWGWRGGLVWLYIVLNLLCQEIYFGSLHRGISKRKKIISYYGKHFRFCDPLCERLCLIKLLLCNCSWVSVDICRL